MGGSHLLASGEACAICYCNYSYCCCFHSLKRNTFCFLEKRSALTFNSIGLLYHETVEEGLLDSREMLSGIAISDERKKEKRKKREIRRRRECMESPWGSGEQIKWRERYKKKLEEAEREPERTSVDRYEWPTLCIWKMRTYEWFSCITTSSLDFY